MSRHTPGPWLVNRDRPTDVITAPYAKFAPSVATVDIGPSDKEEIDANGRLIAAAPDLLEALEQCEEYFDNRADADCDQDGYIPNKEMQLLQVVRDALRKAGAR